MCIYINRIFSPTCYWKRVIILSVSIILLGIFISIAKSHYAAMHRLRNIEYQHELLLKEISTSPEFKKASRLLFDMMLLRSKNRQEYQNHILSSNTIHALVTELQNIKQQHLSLLGSNRYHERTDYALSTAGGAILSTGCTKVMLTPFPQWMGLLGFSGVSKLFVNGAHRIIQPSNEPGECFAFSGYGEVTIKLVKSIVIEAISVEHIPSNVSPDGHILSAPNEFSVYGMQTANDPSPHHLGTFKYDIEMRQSRQEFGVAYVHRCFPIVKFRIAPNPTPHHYTCIYRIRVHGSLKLSENGLAPTNFSCI